MILEEYRRLKADIIKRAGSDPWALALLLKNEKGQSFQPDLFPYMRQILRDWHPNLVIKKATQTGATFGCQVKELFQVLHNPVTIVHTMPRDIDVQQYSAARFKKIVHSHPYVSSRIDSVDQTGLKTFKSGGAIYFRGTWTELPLISVPADILNRDELDRQKPGADDEIRRRLDASTLAWEWAYSTPTIPGFGVDDLFGATDQMTWIVRCPGCRHDNEIDGEYYFRGIKERRAPDGKAELYWSCVRCDQELDRRAGQWVPKYPGKDARGYLVPATLVPHITPARLRTDERKSKSPAKFKRNRLAIACGEGAQLLIRELLLQRAVGGREWQTAVPPRDSDFYRSTEPSPTIMGFDQGDTLHYSISAIIGERRLVIRRGAVTSFDDIGRLMHQYSIWLAVGDGQPNKHSAKALQAAFPGRLLLAYYNDAKREGFSIRPGTEPGSIILDRSETLDDAANSWAKGESLATKPDDAATWEDWLSQMVAMQRDMEEDANGFERVVWRKTGPDHYRHADNYNLAAWRILTAPEEGETVVHHDPVEISPI